MRSLTRDSEVTKRKLAPGTVRRIAGFATPYKFEISIFLVLVIVDAVISVAIPLLFKVIIDEVDTNGGGSRSVVIGVALAIAGLAIFDAGLSLIQRYFSSRIGEGLIYDLRTQVFDHVQRMPVAFFTRTQTGALVSRLNNDVIGAQQAFTSTLSVGRLQRRRPRPGRSPRCSFLSWQITLGALVLLPVFLLPARWVGRKLQGITREAMQLNADDEHDDDRAVQRLGRAAGQALRPARRRGAAVLAARPGGCATSASRRRCTAASSSPALTLVAVARHRARLRRRRRARASTATITVGTLVALAALLDPPLRPAHRAVQRAGRRDDRAGLLRAGLRGARPAADDRREARRDGPAAGRAAVEFRRRVVPLPDGRRGVAGLARVRRRARPGAEPAGAPRRLLRASSPGTMVALVGPSGAGKTTITALVARLYDVTGGAVRVGGHDVRDVTLESLHDVVGVVTQDAHMFHDTIRANLLYARPERDRGRARRGLPGRADLGPGRGRCPTASTPSSATAATGCPAARSSAWRSPGCCSRRPTSSCSTRRPPTSTPSPRSPCSGRSRPRSTAAPRS